MSNTPERTNGSKTFDGRELARRLYGGPPEADSCTVAHYRRHLHRRFGAGVPEEVVSAFAEAHRLGREHPDQIEALTAGLRAGTAQQQRERAAGGDGR